MRLGGVTVIEQLQSNLRATSDKLSEVGLRFNETSPEKPKNTKFHDAVNIF